MAAIGRFGQHVIPRDGRAYEDLIAFGVLRGAHVQGYDTTILRLSVSFPGINASSYMLSADVDAILQHLTRPDSERTAVVVINGPAAPGFDIASLHLGKEDGQWKMKVVAYSIKHNQFKAKTWSKKFNRLGSRVKRPLPQKPHLALRALARLLLRARDLRTAAGNPPSSRIVGLPAAMPTDIDTAETEVIVEAVVQESFVKTPDYKNIPLEREKECVQFRPHLRPLDKYLLDDTSTVESRLFSWRNEGAEEEE